MNVTDVASVRRWQAELSAKHACVEAVRFAEGYESFKAAWDACPRGDWLLWWISKTIAAKQGPERRRLVRVACQCARLALPYVEAGETRPLRAIEIAERWANGDESVTLAEVRAAYDAAADAAAAAASYASYAAYYAAYAAAADAAAASYAAAAAADAAAADAAARSQMLAAAAAARSQMLARCVEIVRAEYPDPPTANSAVIAKAEGVQ